MGRKVVNLIPNPLIRWPTYWGFPFEYQWNRFQKFFFGRLRLEIITNLGSLVTKEYLLKNINNNQWAIRNQRSGILFQRNCIPYNCMSIFCYCVIKLSFHTIKFNELMDKWVWSALCFNGVPINRRVFSKKYHLYIIGLK